MNYWVEDSKAEHVAELALRMRSGDRQECLNFGVNPRRALWRSYRSSILRRTAFVNGEVAAMWGLGGSMLGIGTPWLLTTPAVESIPKTMVREGRRQVADMLELSPRLEGWVATFYGQAVRFLETLDFIVEPPVDQPDFRRFFLERSHGG